MVATTLTPVHVRTSTRGWNKSRLNGYNDERQLEKKKKNVGQVQDSGGLRTCYSEADDVRAASGAVLTDDQRNAILTRYRLLKLLMLPLVMCQATQTLRGPKKTARRSAIYSNLLELAYHTTDDEYIRTNRSRIEPYRRHATS